MPKPPLPDELQELLREPNPAVMASLKPDGSPLTVATWYLWEDPRVSLTVLDNNWYRHVSLQGRVVAIEPDAGLRDIDRLSNHYRGEDYQNRASDRVSALIEIDRWHAWNV